MSVPNCIWLRNPVTTDRPAMFLFETGGLDCEVTGPGVRTSVYSAAQGPRILVVHQFTEPGVYTWTVSNASGSCTSSVTVNSPV